MMAYGYAQEELEVVRKAVSKALEERLVEPEFRLRFPL